MQPIFIKEFLPKQILDLIYSYTIIKFSDQKKFKHDLQTFILSGVKYRKIDAKINKLRKNCFEIIYF